MAFIFKMCNVKKKDRRIIHELQAHTWVLLQTDLQTVGVLQTTVMASQGLDLVLAPAPHQDPLPVVIFLAAP